MHLNLLETENKREGSAILLFIHIFFCKTTTSILKGFNKSKILKMSLEVQISNLRLF